MKILYITSEVQDYLSDSLLIGLKNVEGLEVQEYPGNKFVYQRNDLSIDFIHSNYYGRGFTLYNLLDERLQNICESLINIESFDLIVISDIYRQYATYDLLKEKVTSDSRIVIVDGDDSPSLFPYNGRVLNWKSLFKFGGLHRKHFYFKRELGLETVYSRYLRLLPKKLLALDMLGPRIYPISFGIPDEKIVSYMCTKLKDFATHIVDKEIEEKVYNCNTSYKFSTEEEYYRDIQSSKYGITTKKGGWDCLRHYELAANSSVLCFKDLDLKDDLCAPHGLIPGFNCISYLDYNDLMEQLERIDEEVYADMLLRSMDWVKTKSCTNLALYFLASIRE